MTTSSKKSASKSAPKSAKKTATKTATKTVKKTETKKPSWMKGPKGCDVNKAISLMQRKQGCTRADLNSADFRQPAMSALNVAENRGYKVKAEKKEGERTIYKVTGSASA